MKEGLTEMKKKRKRRGFAERSLLFGRKEERKDKGRKKKV